MKPSIMKVIRYDYLSTLLFVVSVVFTILLILIIAVGETSVLLIGLIFIAVFYVCLILRVSVTRNEILRLKDSRINAVIHRFDNNNGNFYIVVNYEVKTRSLGKRIP
ncbi:MAG: hypothetical protein KAJ22_02940, partial [Candidatus Izimaplasma sp.]|nr:hypothetical protein [Candidatus Izimaplasma bacterium]